MENETIRQSLNAYPSVSILLNKQILIHMNLRQKKEIRWRAEKSNIS